MSHVNKILDISGKREFIRQKTLFTTPFGTGQGELPVEAGRYRLLWSPVCPWSHCVVIVRHVLGLIDKISLGTAKPIHPKMERIDWVFTLDADDMDPVLRIRYISEIYLKTDASYKGRPTVPVIVDVKEQKVVNNDYCRLTNYFETVWATLHKEYAPDLYPAELREDIDKLNDVIFHDINNGVYKCGFAKLQESYEKAYEVLFKRLDQLEERLSTRRFLFGDFITDSDVRLYVTLVRFDIAYYHAFKVNRNLVLDFPNLWGYLRDLYQTPGFGDTTDFQAIKLHYFLANDCWEFDAAIFDMPHNRELINGKKDKFLIRKPIQYFEGE